MWLIFAVLLLLVYLVIAVGIIHLIARYRNEEPGDYLREENNWFYVGVGVCAVTFVIACFNFGSALLLPENFPNPEQRETMANLANHLLHGDSAVVKPPLCGPEVPKPCTKPTPLPWATGTWFWWKATLLYFLLTFGYFFFAFYDEAVEAYQARRKYAEERRQQGGAQSSAPPLQAPARGQHGFGARLVVEFVAEIVAELVTHLVLRRKTA